ncbi:MAG: tRNA-guanine transglycosylase [Verrucomicrobiales bacterium]
MNATTLDPRSLETPSGSIQFPAYVPVTTFGGKYPLDALIQPYLPRLSQAVMVSHHYAKQMEKRPRLPVMIDSGGFAALFEGSRIIDQDALGLLEINLGDSPEVLTPWDVLDFQEEKADIAFTLDFPIPPGLDQKEARLRHRFSIANAHWALENRRKNDMRLYACIQGWDVASFRSAAEKLADAPFDGFAIGGLVPRARDWTLVSEIVKAVRQVTDSRPLHVFGLGKPETTIALFKLGVDSVDSSSYVKLAADGKSWANPSAMIDDASVPERLRLTLENLMVATGKWFPLSVVCQ